ncbi:hypothetical protein NSK_004419 [Nannochloropsis salina CCMP1776]|uniref:Transmembrane protein n=1 Tax=Nannochloropsis salina CCMP1776 TaxID=1027361 RepID=A0A4D9D0L8_9STRA|nr:hypothetical protein NSK_004419 [Nannochloropsis salina CCMP1776]|eukprot:TFJ84434.1 hypothetical protein NSK_004419 [Nannochloropsis salina CCMP1776]
MRPWVVAFALGLLGWVEGFRLPRAPTSPASSSFTAVGRSSFQSKNSASDDNSGGPANSTFKKRKRKVPLPAELLQDNVNSGSSKDPPNSSVNIQDASSSSPIFPGEVDLQERLQQDIVRFRKKEREVQALEGDVTGFASFADKAGSILQKVLVADFFVVLGFLGWFVTGVVFKSALNDATVIDKFTDIWMPVIQPALGVLMAGTLGVGALNSVASRSQEMNEKKKG